MKSLNKEKDLVKFSGCPVGNSPDFIPWDCSLKNDIKLSCDRHVISLTISQILIQTSSLCPPQSQVHIVGYAYSIQIVVVSPAAFVSMEAVRMADGITIKGVRDCSRKLYIAMEQFTRGGKLTKKAFSDQSVPYVNPNASIAKQIKGGVVHITF